MGGGTARRGHTAATLSLLVGIVGVAVWVVVVRVPAVGQHIPSIAAAVLGYAFLVGGIAGVILGVAGLIRGRVGDKLMSLVGIVLCLLITGVGVFASGLIQLNIQVLPPGSIG